MKITKKQKSEIYFLSQKFADIPFVSSSDEVKEYIAWTVKGKKDRCSTFNRLFLEKRKLDIMIKYWKQDIEFLITKKELLEDKKLKCDFFKKLVASF